jgi:tRNA A-37 threonylcarbamoyl transferase component Bud32
VIKKVHGFSVLEEIGRGGMSSVYAGRHLTLDYPVAIKFLDPSLANNQQFIERFEREAKQASAVESPHIVRVIDYGSEGRCYFIVMEHVDGKDLSQILKELDAAKNRFPYFPAEIAMLIVAEVCQGLKAAHDRGIIHRDIKPSNILLDKHGFTKIVDFGLARDLRSVIPDLTQPGVVLGTPSYMSPEQAAGLKDIDARSDIFSLGVVAYHLLTGRKPFVGERLSEIQEKVIQQAPPPLTRAACPQLTPQLNALVTRMLAKDKAKRYANIDQVLEATHGILEELDLTESVLKRRQEHLKGFMREPVAFAESMRQRNVSECRRLGYHYQTLGAEHLLDATEAFMQVRRLDPGNEEAARALVELKPLVKKSGLEWPTLAGTTRVLDRADAPGATVTLRAAGAGPSARWLFPVVAFLLATVLFFLVRGSRDKPLPPPAATSVAVVDSVEPAADRFVPAVTADTATVSLGGGKSTAAPTPSEDPPAEPPVKPAPQPVAVAKARLAWSTPEAVRVSLDGVEVWQGPGAGELKLEPNKVYRLAFRDAATLADSERTVGPLESGQNLSLGKVVLGRGSLEIFGAPGMTARIDGVDLVAAGGKFAMVQIGEGEHVLTVGLAGYEAKRASILGNGKMSVLPMVATGPGATQYRFRIERGIYHKISCIFLAAGG